jgi:hypothetical protein
MLAGPLALGGRGLPAEVLAGIGSTSLFMGAGGLLPLPSVDGQVVWREVGRYLWSWRRA